MLHEFIGSVGFNAIYPQIIVSQLILIAAMGVFLWRLMGGDQRGNPLALFFFGSIMLAVALMFESSYFFVARVADVYFEAAAALEALLLFKVLYWLGTVTQIVAAFKVLEWPTRHVWVRVGVFYSCIYWGTVFALR